LHRLPGLFADSLPDAWGLMLMEQLLRAMRLLTRDEREVGKAHVRAVFNALFHNHDNHPKNFAWCLNRERRWLLAPAFDT
jgi:serine/threonine protein kinase HipA of HipAB toxin-antitoxin module